MGRIDRLHGVAGSLRGMGPGFLIPCTIHVTLGLQKTIPRAQVTDQDGDAQESLLPLSFSWGHLSFFQRVPGADTYLPLPPLLATAPFLEDTKME